MAVRIKRSRAGSLRRILRVRKGKKIPRKKLLAAKRRAKRTGNKRLLRKVVFALNARRWRR